MYWQLRSYDRRQERYAVGHAAASCFNPMRMPITTPFVAATQECGVSQATGHRPPVSGHKPQGVIRCRSHALPQPVQNAVSHRAVHTPWLDLT